MKHIVKFEKIVSEGKALGYLDGRACFVIGPLPGETAEVRVTKEKKNYVEAELEVVTVASKHRRPAAEDHYLACSPWQGVDYTYQLELKRQMLAEVFARPELKLPVAGMVAAPEATGYRNKLEFSLLTGADKQMSLAFHTRNSSTGLVALPKGCVLGSEAMNKAALGLLERLNTMNISGYIEALTIRQSHTTGELLAVVALHQVPKRDWSDLMRPELASLVVTRVRRGQHELVWHTGDLTLSDTVGGVELAYPYDGFFQTNVPMFERALEQIMAAVPQGARVVDLYGGVGAIGLPLAKRSSDVVSVEIDKPAVKQAEANARAAGLTNYRAVASMAERLDPMLLAKADCIIVDPPRAGLHERVVGALLDAAPKRIIYLSCNPVTQARDMMSLSEHYRAKSVTGFDFYPGTLHLESLVILDRVSAA
ncbi:MAG: rRNA m(5)U methyltransferase [Patescibacteria group bacterium]|nr:rRNA m(5)U methyltransferase [Patescibacteria group bacterium]